jgi:hypothetical protein
MVGLGDDLGRWDLKLAKRLFYDIDIDIHIDIGSLGT